MKGDTLVKNVLDFVAKNNRFPNEGSEIDAEQENKDRFIGWGTFLSKCKKYEQDIVSLEDLDNRVRFFVLSADDKELVEVNRRYKILTKEVYYE